MKDSSIESSKELKSKLEPIEKLLQEKKYKEALAEIRDFESSQKIDKIPSEELFQFYYLKAFVLRSLGSYQDALKSGRKAFSIIKDTNDNKKIAETQYVLGLIHISLGNLKNAEVEIRDALTGFRRVEDYNGTVDALSRLGQIDFIKSNYAKAIDYTLEALEYTKKTGNKRKTAILLGNLGVRYTLMGRWKEAEDNLKLNVKLNEESRDEINLARGLLSLGYVCYLQRDFKKANKYYKQAVKIIFENNYNREFAIYNEYYGELAFTQGKYFLAKDHYKSAIKTGEEIAPESGIISQSYRLLAELQIVEKQYDEALSSCEKALKVATSLDEKIEIGAIHRALGQIYTAKGAGVVGELARHKLTKAKEHFEKSISLLGQIGAKFELGKARLEAVKSNAFEYFDRVAHFANGRGIFEELGSDYYVGKITLAFCEFVTESGEYGKAEVYLKDPEKIFKRLNEKRDLDLVLGLKRKINRILGKAESAVHPTAKYTFANVITKDKETLKIIQEIQKAKDSDLPILLEGETGTGKDLLVKVIHYQSKRRNKRFVPVNCSALPETLLENELFGHKRGAYTGADKDEPGLFEEAEGGTFYFDEIAEVPLSTQVKLLRVIEEKEVTRLGETKPRKVDVRIVASTSRDLKKTLLGESFRKDLYHRLNTFNFRLPPLRERKEDIPLLIEYFLKENKVSERFSAIFSEPKVMKEFSDYDWPGNVRELKNEIERLTISIPNDETMNPQLLLERIINLKKGEIKKERTSLYDELAEFERKRIIQVLEQTNYVKAKAAESLRIPVSSLKSKIKKYGIFAQG